MYESLINELAATHLENGDELNGVKSFRFDCGEEQEWKRIFLLGAQAVIDGLIGFSPEHKFDDANFRAPQKEMLHEPDSIRLFSGGYLNLRTMNVEVITVDDLALGLATKFRWGGFTKTPITVAEHSINVMKRVSEQHQFDALMHDCTEAILQDMPKPIKNLLPDYQKLEMRLYFAMSKHFHFSDFVSAEVKAADLAELQYEWENIKLRQTFQPITVWQSYLAFKEAFLKLKP